MSKKILFFGNERLATGVTTKTPVLRALVEHGYEVAAVVVAQKDSGPSRRGRQLEIAETAEELGIPVIAPQKLRESVDDIKKFGAEAAVLVAYGKIVPQEVIDIFPKGIINIHPSLLPHHRGPTPVESLIKSGDKETGVSLMQLAAEMDAGPVYAQETLLLKGNETKQLLTDQLAALGRDMLIAHLPTILDGSLQAQEQDEMHATYDEKIDKSDAELDFTLPAVELEREVRAHAGWPRSRARIGTTDVIITQTAVNTDHSGTPGTLWIDGRRLGLHTGEGSLEILRLIPAGKQEMTAEGFLAGYRPPSS